jgi:hypothetical protein
LGLDLGVQKLNARLMVYKRQVFIGYRINYNKVYIETKVGYPKWELTIKEGVFTDSDEKRKYQDSGHHPMVMLTAGYMFGSYFGISLSSSMTNIAPQLVNKSCGTFWCMVPDVIHNNTSQYGSYIQ